MRADVQGQGIGGRLMAAILAEPAIAAAGTVYLDVWEGNHRAQAFYRRHGFTVVGAHELTLAGEPLDEPELIMARRR